MSSPAPLSASASASPPVPLSPSSSSPLSVLSPILPAASAAVKDRQKTSQISHTSSGIHHLRSLDMPRPLLDPSSLPLSSSSPSSLSPQDLFLHYAIACENFLRQCQSKYPDLVLPSELPSNSSSLYAVDISSPLSIHSFGSLFLSYEKLLGESRQRDLKRNETYTAILTKLDDLEGRNVAIETELKDRVKSLLVKLENEKVDYEQSIREWNQGVEREMSVLKEIEREMSRENGYLKERIKEMESVVRIKEEEMEEIKRKREEDGIEVLMGKLSIIQRQEMEMQVKYQKLGKELESIHRQLEDEKRVNGSLRHEWERADKERRMCMEMMEKLERRECERRDRDMECDIEMNRIKSEETKLAMEREWIREELDEQRRKYQEITRLYEENKREKMELQRRLEAMELPDGEYGGSSVSNRVQELHSMIMLKTLETADLKSEIDRMKREKEMERQSMESVEEKCKLLLASNEEDKSEWKVRYWREWEEKKEFKRKWEESQRELRMVNERKTREFELLQGKYEELINEKRALENEAMEEKQRNEAWKEKKEAEWEELKERYQRLENEYREKNGRCETLEQINEEKSRQWVEFRKELESDLAKLESEREQWRQGKEQEWTTEKEKMEMELYGLRQRLESAERKAIRLEGERREADVRSLILVRERDEAMRFQREFEQYQRIQGEVRRQLNSKLEGMKHWNERLTADLEREKRVSMDWKMRSNELELERNTLKRERERKENRKEMGNRERVVQLSYANGSWINSEWIKQQQQNAKREEEKQTNHGSSGGTAESLVS